MEMRDLTGAVLMIVLIGMLIAIGVIVSENMGNSVRETQTAYNHSVTIASGVVTVEHATLKSVSYFGNYTNHTWNTGNDQTLNISGPTTFTVFSYGDGTANATYDYYVNSTGTNVMHDIVVDSLAPISSTWLSLIVTVMILAIVLGLIINAFGGGQRR